MILIASMTGALIFGTASGYLADRDTVQGELTQLAWAFGGIVIGITIFDKLGLL